MIIAQLDRLIEGQKAIKEQMAAIRRLLTGVSL